MSCVVFTVGVVFSVITLIRRLDDYTEETTEKNQVFDLNNYMNEPYSATVWEDVVPPAD